MNGIEQVGFSGSVVAGKAVYLTAEFKFELVVAFKIYQGYFFKMHVTPVKRMIKILILKTMIFLFYILLKTVTFAEFLKTVI